MSKYQYPSAEDIKIGMTGGVIRIDPNEGVYLHTNEAHHSVGIKHVYVDSSGAITVERTPEAAGTVITTAVTPDETLAGKNIQVGLSGGAKISKVFFYQAGRKLNLKRQADFEYVASPLANIWFMTVTHKID